MTKFAHRAILLFAFFIEAFQARALIALLVGILMSVVSAGQGPRVIPPSPEVASLGKFGEIPVSNYTGIPNINIPLYTLQAGTFSLPITLSYHAAGIKVEEEAGWVGLGWALQANFSISRTTKGLDDLNAGGYPSGPVPNPNSDAYLTSVAAGSADAEPDIFYLNLPGRSGKFTVAAGGSGIYNGKLFNQEKLSIVYSTTHSKWTVTDEQGTRYIFSIAETALPQSGSGITPLNATANLASGNAAVSAWHVEKIELTNGETIFFDYSASQTAYKTPVAINQESRFLISTSGNIACIPDQRPRLNFLSSRTIFSGFYLAKIRYKDFYIDFVTEDRIDLEPQNPQELPQRLKEIKVFRETGSGVEQVRHFEFSYHYYNNSQSGYLYRRLKLTGIQEKNGSVHIPPYTFDYYASPSYAFDLPAKTSASRDLWGFFNGKNNSSVFSTYHNQIIPECLIPPIFEQFGSTQVTDTGADRSSDEEAGRLGILSKITYPTGGTTEFEFEAHQHLSPWTEEQQQTVALMAYGPSIVSPPVSLPAEAILDFSGASSNTQVTVAAINYCYNEIEFGTPCTNRTGHFGSVYSLDNNNNETLYTNLVKTTVPADYTIASDTIFNLALPPGRYKVRARVLTDSWVSYLNVSYKAPVATHTNQIAGGLRIKEIKSRPDGTAPVQVTGYQYEQSPGVSSGLLMSPYSRYYFFEDLFVWCNDNSGNGSRYYAVRRSWNNFPLGTGAQGSHIGYNLVTVLYGQNGANGKTVYEYMNDQEEIDDSYFIPDETTTPPNSNGLLFRQTDYKWNPGNTYSKVREISNTYENKTGLSTTLTGIKVYPVVLVDVTGPGMFQPYYLNSERWELKEQKETVFENDFKFTEKLTGYFYQNTAHLQLTKQRESQSDGTILETAYKYPLDYAGVSGKAAFIQKLIDAHRVAYPLETVTISEASPSARKTINASVTTYKVFTGPTSYPELLLPYKVFAFHLLDGSGTFAAYPGTSDETASASYRETLRYTNYDTHANPLSLLVNGGDKVSYLWAYKGLYPVAQILNADYGEVASALTGAGSSHNTLSALTSSSAISTVTGAVRTGLTTAQVTSYTYKPLNGMETLTDPAGKTLFYEYDALGRLKNIRDNSSSGAVRASYCYNYAGQAVDCATISTTGTVTPPALELLADDNSPPLPVLLADFEAVKEGETAQLSWTTTSEANSDHFQVERSTDAIAWTTLGTVAAKGNHTGSLRYSFTDPSPASGENFFRLKIVDVDGSFSHSRIESLRFGGDDIIVYPNPITVETTLHLKTARPGKIQKVTLYDMTGKMVYDGAYRERLDVSGLAPGLYLINVIANDGTVSVYRIVKK